jgi:hypothetical protein
MAKMSSSAQVRMNVALTKATDASGITLAQVRDYDLAQASLSALRAGVAALDERGLWRASLDHPRTDDEEKRVIIADELRRRGEFVQA